MTFLCLVGCTVTIRLSDISFCVCLAALLKRHHSQLVWSWSWDYPGFIASKDGILADAESTPILNELIHFVYLKENWMQLQSEAGDG